MNDKTEIELMKSMESIASKLPPGKRPAINVNVYEQSANNGKACYQPRNNAISMFEKDNKGKTLKAEELKACLSHEYGHAVADKLNDKKGFSGIMQEGKEFVGALFEKYDVTMGHMTDSKGRDLKERADTLEDSVKAKGFNPEGAFSKKIMDDPKSNLFEEMNKNKVYNKFDPFVDSVSHRDENGQLKEKYLRTNRDEFFAETFRTYTTDPDAFRSKIADMKNYLTTHKPGSDEYKYVQESYNITNDSYNYFKNNIFNGQEFSVKNPS